MLAAATAKRLEVEGQLGASGVELLRVKYDLHVARDEMTELTRVRSELESARANPNPNPKPEPNPTLTLTRCAPSSSRRVKPRRSGGPSSRKSAPQVQGAG